MEPGMYFVWLVMGIGALHLVWNLAAYVSRFQSASEVRRTDSEGKIVSRDDWYMFFHCSDLTGQIAGNQRNKTVPKSSGRSAGTSRQRDSRLPATRHYPS